MRREKHYITMYVPCYADEIDRVYKARGIITGTLTIARRYRKEYGYGCVIRVYLNENYEPIGIREF